MSRYSCITTCVVLVTILSLSGELSAQGPSLRRSQRPVTSPYLNLLNRGNNNFLSPGLNYYRNVRPEQELRQGLQDQDSELQALAQQFNMAARTAGSDTTAARSFRSALNTTGHSTSFRNVGSYFRGRP